MTETDEKTLTKRLIEELRKLSPRELKRRLHHFTAEQREKADAAARADPHLLALWEENGWLDADGLPDLDNPHVRLTWTMAAPSIVRALCAGNRQPLTDALPDDQRAECMEIYLNYVSPEDGSKYCDIEKRNFYIDGIREYRRMAAEDKKQK